MNMDLENPEESLPQNYNVAHPVHFPEDSFPNLSSMFTSKNTLQNLHLWPNNSASSTPIPSQNYSNLTVPPQVCSRSQVHSAQTILQENPTRFYQNQIHASDAYQPGPYSSPTPHPDLFHDQYSQDHLCHYPEDNEYVYNNDDDIVFDKNTSVVENDHNKNFCRNFNNNENVAPAPTHGIDKSRNPLNLIENCKDHELHNK